MTLSARPRNILFVGPVFPEPTSSAAGLRTVSLLDDFLSRGDRILFVSPSDQNAFAGALQAKGVATRMIGPNDPAFDLAVREFAPDVAVFDRFMLEEQFGWRVAEGAPAALRILDTIDLHFLRRVRGERLKDARIAAAGSAASAEGASIPDAELARISSSLDGIETEDCLRELAAIHLSDLSLILSRFEMKLLKDRFGVDESILHFMGFSYPAPDRATWRPFAERRHFVSIGNFRHLPNRDATFWLARSLWPKIRAEFAARGAEDVELHLYGAYPPKEIMALDSPKTGFRVLGPAAEAIATLRDYRVCLAPIRFGAGIKGKIADAWAAGVPVVTTPLGAEGMEAADALPFAGAVAGTEAGFVAAAATAYTDDVQAAAFREAGAGALGTIYSETENRRAFLGRIDALLADPDRLAEHRRRNVFGRILAMDAHARTKYFSRWIEEKNRRPEAGRTYAGEIE
jgi:glycosyltransferase involved in cell wall biosynthesis